MLRGRYGAPDESGTLTRAGRVSSACRGTHIHSAARPHSSSHSLGEFSGDGVHSSIRQFPVGDLFHTRHQVLVACCYHLISPVPSYNL